MPDRPYSDRPTTPTNLRVTGATAYSVSFAWNPSTDNSGSVTYVVYKDGQGFTVPQGQTTYTIDWLSPGRTYNFYVAAYDKVHGACVVVDFGTAVTYDPVSAEGEYLGGIITPGVEISTQRIQRERLEPYFKLQKEANLNVIRNWMGTNTQDSFYELCDEYGMMVLNDFWASTQDFQVEPQDPQLFLQNAVDTVRRYRNHPSIVLWFGRNEGVPQPILNEGLGDVIAKHDGTRHFMGSSNVVNLSGSGPYNSREGMEAVVKGLTRR